MELVDVLDVSKHDVVLVAETRRDVLGATRHLPQVRLPPHPQNIYFNVSHHIMGWSLAPSLAFDQFTHAVHSSVSRGGCFVLINYLRTYLNTLLEVSHVDPLCLEELRHDVPEHKHRSVKCVPD